MSQLEIDLDFLCKTNNLSENFVEELISLNGNTLITRLGRRVNVRYFGVIENKRTGIKIPVGILTGRLQLLHRLVTSKESDDIIISTEVVGGVLLTNKFSLQYAVEIYNRENTDTELSVVYLK